MAEHVNGTTSGTDKPQDRPASPRRIEDVIDPQVRQVVGVTVRGLLVSAPGVPPAELVKSIARQTGYALANSINGDLQAVLKLRREFKDAFDKGVSDVKIVPPMNMPPRN